jgi:Phosphotransferase enzyme family
MSDRVSGRLAERVARLEPEILAMIPSREPATLRICPLHERSVHEIAILELVRASGRAHYFVKSTVEGYSGKQDLATEGKILAEVGPRIAACNPETRCPQCLAFFPEEKLLIEEFVPGPSLKSLLFDFMAPAADVRYLSELSGEWLAHFHTQTRYGTGAPFEWLWEEFRDDLLGETFRRCRIPELYEVALRLLRRFSRQFPDLSRPICQVHGEFTPLHILVRDRAIYVIDFGSSRRGFAHADLARFSTFCETLLPWRRAAALPRLPVSRQTSSFLRSYAAHAGIAFAPADDVIMRFARLCAMAHQQVNWERGPRSHSERLPLQVRRTWTRWRFASLARHEIRQLQQTVEANSKEASRAARVPAVLGADTPVGD